MNLPVKPPAIEYIPLPGTDTEMAAVRGPDGEPYLLLKPACESLGITSNAQRIKLDQAHWAVTAEIVATGSDGKNYRMTGLHVDCVPMWLVTISPGKVAPEGRPILIAFQKEATRALRDHFFGGPSTAVTPVDRFGLMRQMVDAIEQHDKAIAEARERSIVAQEQAIAALAETIRLSDEGRLQDARITALEGDHDEGRIAALAYLKTRKLPADVGACQRLGVEARKIGLAMGMGIQTIPHRGYGTQNVWPTEVWDVAMSSIQKRGGRR